MAELVLFVWVRLISLAAFYKFSLFQPLVLSDRRGVVQNEFVCQLTRIILLCVWLYWFVEGNHATFLEALERVDIRGKIDGVFWGMLEVFSNLS